MSMILPLRLYPFAFNSVVGIGGLFSLIMLWVGSWLGIGDTDILCVGKEGLELESRERERERERMRSMW